MADPLPSDLLELTAVIRRVVGARMGGDDGADDVVQETLARVLAALPRLDDRSVGPYAVVTARNLVTTQWQRRDVGKRHAHRLVEPAQLPPEERIVEREERETMRTALDRLAPEERDVLLAHEVDGRATRALADDLGSTPGAVAAQLNRTRAKLRVEYLLELHGEPPGPQCRPVLMALSSGDRRRQAELETGYHLLDCDFCATLSEPLFDRRSKAGADEARIPISQDADIVAARQRGRDLALHAGFSATEATVIATAISEVSRNIVRFARKGVVTATVLSDDGTKGLLVVAQDVGPGIPDVRLALTEGYTTYDGLGLGLPGSMKLMDEFEITSEVGRGTTVTMAKWIRR